MTIRKSQPSSITAAMSGDMVRIVEPAGSAFRGLPQTGPVTKGAYGKLEISSDGRYSVIPHSLMPAELVALERIELSQMATIERISHDTDKELSVLALQYLQQLSTFVRTRASGDSIATVLKATLKASAQPVMVALQESGLSMVEHVRTVSKVERRVYVTSNPNDIADGVVPADAIAFDIEPEDSSSVTTNVHAADQLENILYSSSQVREANSTPAAQATPPARALSPFVANLLGLGGDDQVNASDLDFPDPEDDMPRLS